jgi:hypothetical protein
MQPYVAQYESDLIAVFRGLTLTAAVGWFGSSNRPTDCRQP